MFSHENMAVLPQDLNYKKDKRNTFHLKSIKKQEKRPEKLTNKSFLRIL